MSKTTFTPEQLEEAIESLTVIDDNFPDYPILNGRNHSQLWSEETFPIRFRKIGDDENVYVSCKEYFGGEEGGDHRMYMVIQTGWGTDTRYFMKTGEYNSWDSSEWDGEFYEVVAQEVKKTEWVNKK
jgi:hypothetical protein